jgi:hypothetical protein
MTKKTKRMKTMIATKSTRVTRKKMRICSQVMRMKENFLMGHKIKKLVTEKAVQKWSKLLMERSPKYKKSTNV